METKGRSYNPDQAQAVFPQQYQKVSLPTTTNIMITEYFN